MTCAIVVGGGISGLVASLLLNQRYDQVKIIEVAPACGGLLASVQDDAGNYYDQGTHIPDITGVDEIDKILFGEEIETSKNWHFLEYLNTGNMFNGSWNFETQTIDIKTLNKTTRARIEADILTATANPSAKTMEEYLIGRFGEYTTTNVFGPVFKKLYGQDVNLGKLASTIGGGQFFTFGHDRLVAFDQEKAAELKTDPVFDAKLSFHTQREFLDYMNKFHSGGPRYCYPTNGKGIGAMIERIISQVKAAGIEIITNSYVEGISFANNRITGLNVHSIDQVIECDHVFWSAPPVLGLKAANLNFVGHKLQSRCSNIFHFCFDAPLLNDVSHFLWSWDINDPIFRLTLYDNFRPSISPNRHLLTVECLSNIDDADELTANKVQQSLVEMGVISKAAKCISQTEQRLKNTFPVPDLNFKNASERNYSDLKEAFCNISISGRYSGKVWAQSAVLHDTFQQISAL